MTDQEFLELIDKVCELECTTGRSSFTFASFARKTDSMCSDDEICEIPIKSSLVGGNNRYSIILERSGKISFWHGPFLLHPDEIMANSNLKELHKLIAWNLDLVVSDWKKY